MRGTVLYGPRDVRFEDREDPRIEKPTDAILRIAVTCVCGSDLWPYRGIQKIAKPTAMGHEYCGVVEEVGSAVRTVKPGQFVIGSFCISDNTCPNCRAGYQSGCQNLEFMSRAQAPLLRVPWADGTLVPTPGMPSDDLLPSLLAVSDVLGTGWFAADAANVKPRSTVVVVGDGAVGLLGVLSARMMGAERIIAMSRHDKRQHIAREFGATEIVAERGNEGVARIKELTDGIGADSVLECVGSEESMMQAIRSTRPGGSIGYVGVPHGMRLDMLPVFFHLVRLHGGPAPVRRYLPDLIKLVWEGKINPGKVFDLTLPLEQVAEGYRAMDERRAIKALLLHSSRAGEGAPGRIAMIGWTEEELRKIAGADDLHISPFRDDGVSYGTPTWIWSVVVDDGLYVRAYNGKQSRWYQAAVKQKMGRIRTTGMTREVAFQPVQGSINERIDDAYREKYKRSPYLAPMIGERARSATMKITPRL